MRTKIECIQEICRRLGKPPVSATDTGGSSLAAHVERALDDASISVQSPGWHWNTKYNVEVATSDNKIQINQLETVLTEGEAAAYATIFHVDTDGTDNDINVIRNGNFLYNATDNTETFTSSLRLMYSWERPIQQVPTPFQEWIISLAALNYNRQDRNYNPARDQILQAEMQDARRKSIREEVRSEDINFLDTEEIRQFRGRPRMPNRSVY